MGAPVPVVTVKHFQPGIGFTTIRRDVPYPGLSFYNPTPINVWSGFAYGFIVTPVNSTWNSKYIWVSVRGVGKKSNDIMCVQPNTYYECPFDALDLVAAPGPEGQTDEGTVRGEFVFQIVTKDYARIYPGVAKLTASDWPAASGGVPTMFGNTVGGLTQAGTGPVPALSTDGTEIGSCSMYRVCVGASDGTSLITAGAINIWIRENNVTAGYDAWHLAAQEIQLPTGAIHVCIPVDRIGPHDAMGINSDPTRFYAQTVGVTGAAGYNVSWMLQ